MNLRISIHAPAWGATIVQAMQPTPIDHFNPRARVGRDRKEKGKWQSTTYFNPRARVGRDNYGGGWCMTDSISIHAPAWGATCSQRARPPYLPFQSTRPRGARRHIFYIETGSSPFQSTRPRGARPRGFAVCSTTNDFNPRARVGRDRRRSPLLTPLGHFNPRARVGRDPAVAHLPFGGTDFNPRARVGRDE